MDDEDPQAMLVKCGRCGTVHRDTVFCGCTTAEERQRFYESTQPPNAVEPEPPDHYVSRLRIENARLQAEVQAYMVVMHMLLERAAS